MMKGPDAFERSLKGAVESYEVPYNSADWTLLEKELGKVKGGAWQSSAGLFALLLGGAIAVSTTIYLITRTDGADPVGNVTVASIQPEALIADTGNSVVTSTDTTDPVANQVVPTPAPTRSEVIGSGQVLSSAKSETITPAAPKMAVPVVPATPNGTKEIGIRTSVSEGCPGSVIEFTADNLSGDGNLLWNFGDGSFSKDKTPKHTFSKAGRFEVMLSHNTIGGGTIHNKPVSGVIVIHETPSAAFNLLKQEFDNTVPSVHFENRSLRGQTYAWDFGDGSTSTVAHPSHVYKTKGTYTVSLLVTNGAGCTDRAEKNVRIDSDYNLLAARSFSPNGDGVEDNFVPEALKTLGVKFHMSVHDPVTGDLVFETTDAQRPWNGRVGGRGEPCATADYVWLVEMKDGDKLGGTYNGTVSLVR